MTNGILKQRQVDTNILETMVGFSFPHDVLKKEERLFWLSQALLSVDSNSLGTLSVKYQSWKQNTTDWEINRGEER